MKKIVGTLVVAGLMLVGVIAAPAASAAESKYTKAENAMWELMKDTDYRAAKWGGKRNSIELGRSTCNNFDEHGVRKTLNWLEDNVEEYFSTRVGQNWAAMTPLAASYTLCREHRSAVDYHLESYAPDYS